MTDAPRNVTSARMARLDKSGMEVRCYDCNAKIADIIVGPGTVPLIEWGGPILKEVPYGREQRLACLVSGMVWQENAAVWQLSKHARKNKRRSEPTTHRGYARRNGLASYPARVRCPQCDTIQTMEKAALNID